MFTPIRVLIFLAVVSGKISVSVRQSSFFVDDTFMVDKFGNTVSANSGAGLSMSKWSSFTSQHDNQRHTGADTESERVSHSVRRCNLQEDVLNRSVSAMKRKTSAFNQTLQRNHHHQQQGNISHSNRNYTY